MRVLLLAALTLAALLAGCANDAETPGSPPPATAASTLPIREDTKEFVLGPRQNIEWKFGLEEGSSLEFTWSATRPVNFDLHGDNSAGAFKSFKQGTAASDTGTHDAPFRGRHGWWFDNASPQTVTITLHTRGPYEIIGKTGGNAS